MAVFVHQHGSAVSAFRLFNGISRPDRIHIFPQVGRLLHGLIADFPGDSPHAAGFIPFHLGHHGFHSLRVPLPAPVVRHLVLQGLHGIFLIDHRLLRQGIRHGFNPDLIPQVITQRVGIGLHAFPAFIPVRMLRQIPFIEHQQRIGRQAQAVLLHGSVVIQTLPDHFTVGIVDNPVRGGFPFLLCQGFITGRGIQFLIYLKIAFLHGADKLKLILQLPAFQHAFPFHLGNFRVVFMHQHTHRDAHNGNQQQRHGNHNTKGHFRPLFHLFSFHDLPNHPVLPVIGRLTARDRSVQGAV